jgi:hypothetical protein
MADANTPAYYGTAFLNHDSHVLSTFMGMSYNVTRTSVTLPWTMAVCKLDRFIIGINS